MILKSVSREDGKVRIEIELSEKLPSVITQPARLLKLQAFTDIDDLERFVGTLISARCHADDHEFINLISNNGNGDRVAKISRIAFERALGIDPDADAFASDGDEPLFPVHA